MRWRYVIIKHSDEEYGIHEYYPKLKSWTVDPELCADSPEELIYSLHQMLEDIEDDQIYEEKDLL